MATVHRRCLGLTDGYGFTSRSIGCIRIWDLKQSIASMSQLWFENEFKGPNLKIILMLLTLLLNLFDDG